MRRSAFRWVLRIEQHVRVARVIGHDDDDVGLGRWRIGGVDCCQRSQQQSREECGRVFHKAVFGEWVNQGRALAAMRYMRPLRA